MGSLKLKGLFYTLFLKAMEEEINARNILWSLSFTTRFFLTHAQKLATREKH